MMCEYIGVILYKYLKCRMQQTWNRKNIENAICIDVFMKHEYDMKYEKELKHEHEHERQYFMNT